MSEPIYEPGVLTHYGLGRILFWELQVGRWYETAKPRTQYVCIKCPKCNGTGRVMVFKEPTDRCYRCNGAKVLHITKAAWERRQSRHAALSSATSSHAEKEGK